MVDGPVAATTCSKCGEDLQTGIGMREPAAYPEDRELYENLALDAAPHGRCDQCGEQNGHLELGTALVFVPGQQVFILPPPSLDDDQVDQILDETLAGLDDEWTVEVSRDPVAFGTAAFAPILARIDQDQFVELKPTGERDFVYHSALLTLSRPGLLEFKSATDGAAAAEIVEALRSARALQVVESFVERFGDADVTTFDPLEELAELFPVGCFDADGLGLLNAAVEERAAAGEDVAALRAGVAAAVVLGGGNRGGQFDLARDLVRLSLAGAVFRQAPEDWAELLTASEVFEAIGAEMTVEGPADFETAVNIAETLGYGDEVAGMAVERIHLDLEEGEVEATVDAMLEVGRLHGVDDEALGETIATIARMPDLGLARRASLAIVDRFVDERPLLVVSITQVIAARLKNEGSARGALDLLDAVEPRLRLESLPPAARSRLLNERGNALRELQRLEAALAAYRQAIAIFPGGVEDERARVAMINEARTLRDLGRLRPAQSAFARVLPYTAGRQRFDCLTAIAITYQREADYAAAQTAIDEAYDLLGAATVDDQITRLVALAEFNARFLGRSSTTPLDLWALVDEASEVSDRQTLLTLGNAGAYALQTADRETLEELLPLIGSIVRGLDLVELATADPEFALTWLPVARLSGEGAIAQEVIAALLASEMQPVMTMRVATIGAQMACEEEEWDEAATLAGRAIGAAVAIADLGSAGTSSLGIVETLGEVRALGAAIGRCPAGPPYDSLLGRLADAQCSLLLSLQLGAAGPEDGATPPASSAQILQWLDAGEAQVPILSVGTDEGLVRRRGAPLETEVARGVGERVSGRIARSTAFASGDLVAGVAPYEAFRREFEWVMGTLDCDAARPLTVVPSAALVGIPLHHAMPELDVSYAPSFAVAAELSRRAAVATPAVATVAEVRCTCFDDSAAIVDGLAEGGRALAEICDRAPGIGYRCVEGLAATGAAVERLMAEADIVKLSCHGVASVAARRFALLLSDGERLPPPLVDIATRDDLADRYLFDWDDLAAGAGRCRLVISSACTSGSGLATRAGEYIGLARGYLASGVLAFVAPLWPVAAAPAQEFANAFIEGCLVAPDQPVAVTLRRTRLAMAHLPPRVADAFVLHGHAGAIFK